MSERRLVLVRHAEAGQAPTDRDRALTDRGQQQAAAVGAALAKLGIAPDRVVVSPARRTLQTWGAAAGALDGAPDPETDERIWDNTVDGLFEVVRGTTEDVGTLVVVGHNPAVGTLAHDLDDGTGDEAARDRLNAGFPPASVAVFDLPASFAEMGPNAATLLAFVPTG